MTLIMTSISPKPLLAYLHMLWIMVWVSIHGKPLTMCKGGRTNSVDIWIIVPLGVHFDCGTSVVHGTLH